MLDAVAKQITKDQARITLLKTALVAACELLHDLEDRLDLAEFGPDTLRSILIAQSAAKYGVANTSDSAYSLDDISLEDALKIIASEIDAGKKQQRRSK